jgi:hypothetical protein
MITRQGFDKWSDIDMLVLTDRVIGERQANRLVGLRQAMLNRYPGNPYFRHLLAYPPYARMRNEIVCHLKWARAQGDTVGWLLNTLGIPALT